MACYSLATMQRRYKDNFIAILYRIVTLALQLPISVVDEN